jgi:hypothetical protein
MLGVAHGIIDIAARSGKFDDSPLPLAADTTLDTALIVAVVAYTAPWSVVVGAVTANRASTKLPLAPSLKG